MSAWKGPHWSSWTPWAKKGKGADSGRGGAAGASPGGAAASADTLLDSAISKAEALSQERTLALRAGPISPEDAVYAHIRLTPDSGRWPQLPALCRVSGPVIRATLHQASPRR